MTEIERFERKIEMVTESGCWIWMAYCAPQGYGRFFHNRVVIEAHRASYELYNAEIKGGLHVLHRCDNPSCVNPNHLFLGTQSDNNKDCVRKGRYKNANSGKSHCKHGHELNGENTYITPNGYRQCKPCRRLNQRKRLLLKKVNRMNDIVKTGFDLGDIRRVQVQRKDLSDDQASEVLGFLNDTYAVEPYNMNSDKLFKTAADMMYPL